MCLDGCGQRQGRGLESGGGGRIPRRDVALKVSHAEKVLSKVSHTGQRGRLHSPFDGSPNQARHRRRLPQSPGPASKHAPFPAIPPPRIICRIGQALFHRGADSRTRWNLLTYSGTPTRATTQCLEKSTHRVSEVARKKGRRQGRFETMYHQCME